MYGSYLENETLNQDEIYTPLDSEFNVEQETTVTISNWSLEFRRSEKYELEYFDFKLKKTCRSWDNRYRNNDELNSNAW